MIIQHFLRADKGISVSKYELAEEPGLGLFPSCQISVFVFCLGFLFSFLDLCFAAWYLLNNRVSTGPVWMILAYPFISLHTYNIIMLQLRSPFMGTKGYTQ